MFTADSMTSFSNCGGLTDETGIVGLNRTSCDLCYRGHLEPTPASGLEPLAEGARRLPGNLDVDRGCTAAYRSQDVHQADEEGHADQYRGAGQAKPDGGVVIAARLGELAEEQRAGQCGTEGRADALACLVNPGGHT